MLLLNIANIRSVTINPPTTLIVANIIAITDIIIARIPLAFETIMIAPTITMPAVSYTHLTLPTSDLV